MNFTQRHLEKDKTLRHAGRSSGHSCGLSGCPTRVSCEVTASRTNSTNSSHQSQPPRFPKDTMPGEAAGSAPAPGTLLTSGSRDPSQWGAAMHPPQTEPGVHGRKFAESVTREGWWPSWQSHHTLHRQSRGRAEQQPTRYQGNAKPRGLPLSVPTMLRGHSHTHPPVCAEH